MLNGNPTPAILAAYIFGSHSTGKAKLRIWIWPFILFPGQENAGWAWKTHTAEGPPP